MLSRLRCYSSKRLGPRSLPGCIPLVEAFNSLWLEAATLRRCYALRAVVVAVVVVVVVVAVMAVAAALVARNHRRLIGAVSRRRLALACVRCQWTPWGGSPARRELVGKVFLLAHLCRIPGV